MTDFSKLRMSKTEVVGHDGLIVAEHPVAVSIGLDILRDGGNAMDAAVAVAFALGVVMPGNTGIGGGGSLIAFDGAARSTTTVDFSMRAPKAAAPDSYELTDGFVASRFGWRAVRADENMHGWRAAAIPGFVQGLELAHKRMGSRAFGPLLKPAVELAERGVTFGWPTIVGIATKMSLLSRDESAREILLPRGFPPRPSTAAYGDPDRIVQSDLAKTLKEIAKSGSMALSTGRFAETLDAVSRRNDGLLTGDDLVRNQPILSDGQVTRFGSTDIIGVPGPHGCFTVQQMLSMLEPGLPLAQISDGDRLHLYIEVAKRALADRRRYGGDPDQSDVPYDGLLSVDYARERRNEIGPRLASHVVEAGDPWAFSSFAAPVRPGRTAPSTPGGATSSFCVADGVGNVVTLTSTLVDSFGAGVVVPGTGVLLNNAMQWVDPEQGSPNSIASLRRGLNNMTPLMVVSGDEAVLAVGASGGARILDAVTQIVLNVVERGMPVQDAITDPRIDCSGDTILVDERVGGDVVDDLEGRGHSVAIVEESPYGHIFARPAAIQIDQASGLLRSGADPFHPMYGGAM